MKKWLILSVAVILDQVTKNLAYHDLLPSWGGLFSSICNYNLAWSIKIPSHYFVITWILAVLLLSYLFWKNKYNIFLGLVLIGAVLNIIDRAVYGCVVDFIRLGRFPIFNIADIMISVGIFVFAYQQLKQK